MGLFDFLKRKKEMKTNQTVKKDSLYNSFSPIVLWWIDQKKKGYDVSSNSFPKWFKSSYNIDFNVVLNAYIEKKYLCYTDPSFVMLTDEGKKFLHENSCIIIMHQHPEYKLTMKDFSSNAQWHKIGDNDIIWSIFNKRQLEYTEKFLWDDLMQNYLNMANLLFEEAKYTNALEMICPAIFIATSGMHNYNKLSPYENEQGYLWVSFLEISHYTANNIRLIMEKMDISLERVKQFFYQSKQINALRSDILPFYYLDVDNSWIMLQKALDENQKKGIFTLKDLYKSGIRIAYNVPQINSKKYFYNSTENIIRNYHP